MINIDKYLLRFLKYNDNLQLHEGNLIDFEYDNGSILIYTELDTLSSKLGEVECIEGACKLSINTKVSYLYKNANSDNAILNCINKSTSDLKEKLIKYLECNER